MTPGRVYLVGAHSTGKTTLARYIRDHYGLPMISEVARSVAVTMPSSSPVAAMMRLAPESVGRSAAISRRVWWI